MVLVFYLLSEIVETAVSRRSIRNLIQETPNFPESFIDNFLTEYAYRSISGWYLATPLNCALLPTLKKTTAAGSHWPTRIAQD